jgi:Fe-S cluster assembly ATP-binding protein
MSQLELKNIFVTRDTAEVVHDVTLTVSTGEVVFLMGPNGSGKSSLVNAVAGHPKYRLVSGEIVIDGEDITQATADEKSRKGLFLAMQQQVEIPGITVSGLLRAAVSAHRGLAILPLDFHKMLMEKMQKLGIDSAFANRTLGGGFSGGEKKRLEMLQLAMLSPKFAILDETDAGLDIDALKIVGETVVRAKDAIGFVIITHNPALLDVVRPDRVYVMKDGGVVCEGGVEIAEKIAKEGYSFLVTGN